MEGVILKMSGVKMFASKFITSVFSNDPLEVVHGEEVWIVPAGSEESH